MSRTVASTDGNDALLPLPERSSVFKELVAILKIAIPIFMAMVSWVAMKVGRHGRHGRVGTCRIIGHRLYWLSYANLEVGHHCPWVL